MKKYVLDFEFDESSGESYLLIDVQDESMTALELNEAIQSGETRDEVLRLTEELFGSRLAEQVRSGRLPLVCLDDHPAENPRVRT